MTNKYIFTLILITVILVKKVYSCTNILVTAGASVDKSVLITYAADAHFMFGELYHFPAAEWPEGTLLDIIEWDSGEHLGRIKQAHKTYAVIGNMNEYQVSVGETTFTGRTELQDTTGIIDYGSLMYIALQRSRTALEAIKVITSLVEEYGYYSTGESFSIADPKEAWILELIGKGIHMVPQGKGKERKMGNQNKGAVWVARRVPDGYVSAHANQARITTFPLNDPDNCLYSPDVISFAREKGYFTGREEEFSFADAYAPLDFKSARFCEARVWAVFNRITQNMDQYLDYAMGTNLSNRMPLWVKPDRLLNTHDVMELMRDYYQGTPMDMTGDFGAGPYGCIIRWRPLVWEVDGKKYFNERAISTQQTGFSFVAQMRSWLPDAVGGILWFGVDDTYSTVYTPIYCGITEVPQSFAVGNGSIMEFSDNAAFWIFNQVSNFAYTRYGDVVPEIREKQGQLEKMFIAFTPTIDKAAAELYEHNPELAKQFLTKYSINTANSMVDEWKKFYQHLFVKYMDGNTKFRVEGKRNPEVMHPGYSEEWYRLLIQSTGDKFLIPEN